VAVQIILFLYAQFVPILRLLQYLPWFLVDNIQHPSLSSPPLFILAPHCYSLCTSSLPSQYQVKHHPSFIYTCFQPACPSVSFTALHPALNDYIAQFKVATSTLIHSHILNSYTTPSTTLNTHLNSQLYKRQG